MAVIKPIQLTSAEKKLKTLREQLYGKNPVLNTYSKISSATNYVKTNTEFTLPIKNSLTDINYLKTDLLKILILAVVAFTAQITLYISINNNYFKF